MTCGIYMITNLINGAEYIGLSKNIEKRWHDHPKRDSKIGIAIQKIGIENFSMRVLEVLPNDKSVLEEREKYWIKKYNTFEDDFHYNQTPGGHMPCNRDYSYLHSPEIRKKRGEIMKKKWQDPIFREKRISQLKGVSRSPETRAKMSASAKKRYKEGGMHPFKGCHHSDNAKKSISLAQSKLRNKTGFYRVSIKYQFQYKENGKMKKLYGNTLEKVLKQIEDKQIPIHKSNRTNTGIANCQKYYHYKYVDGNGKHKDISGRSIDIVKEKVLAKGLEWSKLDGMEG